MARRIKAIGGFGVQVEWEYVDGDDDVARRVVNFLEDRRLLFGERHCEDEVHCVRSALEIRRFLMGEVQARKLGRTLAASLKAMSGACRRFLDAAGPDACKFRHRESLYTDPFSMALGELRMLFGLHLASIVGAYGLDVEPELRSIMHPMLDDDGHPVDGWLPGF